MFLIYKKYAKRVILLLIVSMSIFVMFVLYNIEYVSNKEVAVEQIHELSETDILLIESENNISVLSTEETLNYLQKPSEVAEVETQESIQESESSKSLDLLESSESSEELIQDLTSTEETQPETLPTVSKETQPPTEHREPVALTTETLLEDFDYFALTLRENFPFYGAARRKFGLNLQKQIDNARIAVQNLSTAGEPSQILRRYADILATYIVAPMRTMGHMIGLWAGSSHYNIQLALIKWDATFDTSWYPNLYANHLLGVFTSPTAIRYYGNIFDSIDVNDYIKSTLLTPVPGNVTFKILQADSIAYIKLKSMDSANYDYDGALIAAFGETIADFDHLIIDIRGNHGGYAGNFTEHIMAPLIDEPASFQYYVFFMGGQHAVMFDNIYSRDLQWQIDNGLALNTDTYRFLASDVLPNLTEANADDFARLHYGFKRQITVNPSANRWAFKGKVWILIDGGAYSAAEISAAIAKESGFATLVGTPTFGSFGGYTAAFISLPNTGVIIRYDYGYITDLRGRSLEEFGITPHISNHSGMDALQTALALIAEGQ